jgi:glutathione synthase/RimK-type ligase-like ATP-grasp enzyme
MFSQESTNLLVKRAKELGLGPKLVTDYGLVVITVDGAEHYVFHSKSNLNSQLASYLVSNKHTTRKILERHGFSNIPYCLPTSPQDAFEFYERYTPIIVKPTYGWHSQGVKLIHSKKDLDEVDTSQSIIEQYVKGQEERYLVLNGGVLSVHHKIYDGPINTPSTLKRISIEQTKWSAARAEMALKIAEVFNLGFAAVDFIVTQDETFVLEINSAPGLAWFHNPTHGPAVDVAGALLSETVNSIRAGAAKY